MSRKQGSYSLIAALGATLLAALTFTGSAAALHREFAPVRQQHRGILVFKLTGLKPQEIRAAYLRSTGYRRALDVGRVRAAVRRGLLRVRAPRLAYRVSGRARSARARKWKLVVTPADTTAPTVPGALAATTGDGSVSLSWSPSNDNVAVVGYRLYRRSTDGTWPSTPVSTTTLTTYVDTGLANGTSYSYRATAYDAAGNVSAASSEVAATPLAPPSTGTPPAGGTYSYRWILTGSNMNKIRQIDASLADHFFNTPLAYANGNPFAQQNQTPAGYAAIPTLRYASYATFASDLVQGRVDPAIKAVYYDPEHWSETPVNEQQDPYTYLRLFADLAHSHGYVAITSPARDLMGVPGGVCVAQSGEKYSEAYIRCDIAGAAARYADVSKIQAQVHETDIPAYQSLVDTTAQQARAANPSVVFLSNLSTSVTTVTADQLFNAAQSVNGIVDGHYLTIQASDAGQLNTAVEFFRRMQATGY